jgi:hypothetical protein
MIRRAATAVGLSVLTIAAGLSAPATAGAAARAHCATHADFKKIHRGQSVTRVARELGHRGHIEVTSNYGGYRDQIRTYATCGEFNEVDVTFSANPHKALKVTGKDGLFE